MKKSITIFGNRKALGLIADSKITEIMCKHNQIVTVESILKTFEKYDIRLQINDGLVVSLIEV